MILYGSSKTQLKILLNSFDTVINDINAVARQPELTAELRRIQSEVQHLLDTTPSFFTEADLAEQRKEYR